MYTNSIKTVFFSFSSSSSLIVYTNIKKVLYYILLFIMGQSVKENKVRNSASVSTSMT